MYYIFIRVSTVCAVTRIHCISASPPLQRQSSYHSCCQTLFDFDLLPVLEMFISSHVRNLRKHLPDARYRDLGGTLGTANMAVADVGYVGGVCESYLWRDSSTLRYHALNTAIVNGRLSTGEGLSTTQLVSVIGHEIGSFTPSLTVTITLYFVCAFPLG